MNQFLQRNRTKAGLTAIALALMTTVGGPASAQIQLGMSGGNAGDDGIVLRGPFEIPVCCSGTLGALVTDGMVDYILSNNHVMALSNAGVGGDPIIAPGLIDTEPVCEPSNAGTVASLSDWEPIDFDPMPVMPNLVDAAIAEIVSGQVDTSGSIAMIGEINSGTAAPAIGAPVMKHGRTTGLTFGTVAELNVTVEVLYPDACGSDTGQVAVFDNQIYITKGRFSDGGDSGSLVLTTNQPQAVGLLFAGDNRGTFANSIDDVLGALGVSLITGTNNIDFTPTRGGGGGGGPANGDASPGNRPTVPPGLDAALDVKNAHAMDLLNLPSVGAVGVGVNEDGDAAIVIHLESAVAGAGAPFPVEIEGVPVVTVVSGRAVAY